MAKTYEENVWVFDNENAVVNIITIGNSEGINVNINSRDFKNLKFKIKDNYPEYDFPAIVSAERCGTYITVLDDGKFYSYNSGILEDGDNVIVTRNTNFGKVSVDSNPSGAEIFVDGYNAKITTPAVLDCLSEGWHVIQVSKDGYYSEKKQFFMVDSGPDIDYQLKFLLDEYPYGYLSVNSQPEGCSIYLGGSYTGKKTPYNFEYMPIGTYDVMLMYNRTITENELVTVLPFDKKGPVYCNLTMSDLS
ncbi:MAG: PEGA domain-containing protein [Methanomicrobium sp.]|nr:PEGA domain-containing protein [Methanomicrobium sp.]